MNPGEILLRMKRAVIERGTTVTLNWVERTGGTPDPVTGATVGGTVTPRTADIRALVHSIEAISQLRRFVEIEAGDMIVDFLPDADIDGKENLRFTVNSQGYEQKALGGDLARAWDVMFGEVEGFRTVLLKRAT